MESEGSESSRADAAPLSDVIRKAKQGDQPALERLVTQCRAYLLSVARRELAGTRLGAKVAPSDLVQETLVELTCHIGSFTGETEAELLAWLRRIVVNRMITSLRRYEIAQKREIGLEVPLEAVDEAGNGQLLHAAGLTPSSQAIVREKWNRVEQLLQQLPEVYREVIMLRSFGQYSFAEIGCRINRSEEAARKLFVRGVDLLRSQLKDLE